MTDNFVSGGDYLCHIYWNNENETTVINVLKELKQLDVDNIKSDDRIVREFFGSQNVIESVVANRNDVISAMVLAGKAYADGEGSVESIMDSTVFNVSRLFANTCSLFRSLLDHTDRHIIYKFGKLSHEYAAWKTVLSKEYDRNPSYRLVYHMRNYIQHYDMPPLKISFTENIEKLSMSLSLDLKELTEDKSLARKLSLDEDGAPEEIPIFTVLKQWDESLQCIMSYIRDIRIRDALAAAQRISLLRSQLDINERGNLTIIWFPHVDKKPEKLDMNVFNISEEKSHLILKELYGDSTE